MTSRSTLSRNRMKEEEPEKYSRYLEKQREAGAARRLKEKEEPMTRAKELVMAEKREKHRQHQATYMAKKNGKTRQILSHREPEQNPLSKKKPSQMTDEEKRNHTNALKAASRAREHPEKKRRIKEQKREYMRERRASKRGDCFRGPEEEAAGLEEEAAGILPPF